MRLFKRGKAAKAADEDIVKNLIKQPTEYSRSAMGWIGGEIILVMLYRSVMGKWQVLAARIGGHNPGESKNFKKKEDAVCYFERLVKKYELRER